MQQRSFVFTTIGGSLMAINIYGFQVWTPAFLHRVHHLSSGQIGTYVGTVMGLIGMAGVLLGGLLVEKLGKRDPRWGAYVPALACILCSPLYLLFLFMPSVAGSLIFLLLAGILTRVYMGPTFAICQTVSKVRMRAVASAAFMFFGNLIGLGLGALLIGMLTDALRPRYGEAAIRYSLIAPCVIAVVAGAFFWVAGRYLVADVQAALVDGE
jgi:MFS family permease